MNNKDIHKFYNFLKGFPEHHTLMKNLLVDYLHLKEENEKLVNANLELIEDIKQFKRILQEETELIIH